MRQVDGAHIDDVTLVVFLLGDNLNVAHKNFQIRLLAGIQTQVVVLLAPAKLLAAGSDVDVLCRPFLG